MAVDLNEKLKLICGYVSGNYEPIQLYFDVPIGHISRTLVGLTHIPKGSEVIAVRRFVGATIEDVRYDITYYVDDVTAVTTTVTHNALDHEYSRGLLRAKAFEQVSSEDLAGELRARMERKGISPFASNCKTNGFNLTRDCSHETPCGLCWQNQEAS